MKKLHFKGHAYKKGDWLFDIINDRHDDILWRIEDVEIYGIHDRFNLGDSYELVNHGSCDSILKVEDYNPAWYAVIYDDRYYDWENGSYDLNKAIAEAVHEDCTKIACISNSSCDATKIGEYNLANGEWVYSK